MAAFLVKQPKVFGMAELLPEIENYFENY